MKKSLLFFAPQIQHMENVIVDLTEKNNFIRQNRQKIELLQEQLTQLSSTQKHHHNQM